MTPLGPQKQSWIPLGIPRGIPQPCFGAQRGSQTIPQGFGKTLRCAFAGQMGGPAGALVTPNESKADRRHGQALIQTPPAKEARPA